MDECIDSLRDTAIFSTLDTNWGYWQAPNADEDKDRTTFTGHASTYQFNRIPFGFMSAPATFQRCSDINLNRFIWKTCINSIDNIFIFSTTVSLILMTPRKISTHY